MTMVSWRADRVIAMGGVIAVTALSWLYLAFVSMSHHGRGIMGMAMPGLPGAPVEQFAAAFLMWGIMMVAMMLPTASPAIAMFGSFAGKRLSTTGSAAPTWLFVMGYLAVWTAYSGIAAAGQVALSRASLLAPTLQSTSVVLSASLLVVAGGFQFTPLKDACLTQCRSPFPFLLANWRDGSLGAFVLGMRHGSYCVACCWALMGLMFVFGAMNLLWMGMLSLFMLGEKLAPASWRLSRGAGVLSILWGLFLAAGLVRNLS
jgi:predicted metal-binding membrane protein